MSDISSFLETIKTHNANKTFDSVSGYDNLFGSDLIKNRDFQKDIRAYYASQGKSFSSTSEMLDEWYSDRRWIDSNFGAAGYDMGKYNMGSEADKATHTRLAAAWQRAPSRGTIWDQLGDYGGAIIADPINFVPYAGVASKLSKVGKVAQAARAAGQSRKAARVAGLYQGAKEGALLEGTIGAGLGAGFDRLQQSREIQQGLREEFDNTRTGTAAAIEAGVGGVLGGVIGRFASGKQADAALNWRNNSRLASTIDARLLELGRMEADLQSKIADDTLLARRAEFKDDLADAQAERADIEMHVREVEGDQNALDELGEKIANADKTGEDKVALQAEFQTRLVDVEKKLDSQFWTANTRNAPPAAAATPPPNTGGHEH